MQLSKRAAPVTPRINGATTQWWAIPSYYDGQHPASHGQGMAWELNSHLRASLPVPSLTKLSKNKSSCSPKASRAKHQSLHLSTASCKIPVQLYYKPEYSTKPWPLPGWRERRKVEVRASCFSQGWTGSSTLQEGMWHPSHTDWARGHFVELDHFVTWVSRIQILSPGSLPPSFPVPQGTLS